VEQEEVAIARQKRITHFFAATDSDTTIEEPLEAAFSIWSMPRLYSEDQQQVSQCEKDA
jgi:hypothetical protein